VSTRPFCFIFILFIAVAHTGCNYTIWQNSKKSINETFGELDPNEKLSEMNYAFISENILKPRCIGCHGSSGGVNLETYRNVVANKDKIHSSVFVDGTMPKQGSLTEEEKRLLWHWLNLDCPLGSQDPSPPIEELTPTFDSIDNQIFQVKCVSCHSAGQEGKRILLDKQSLLNSPLELVLPGNPDESGLVIAVERTDEKRMPLAKSGFSPLTPDEMTAIRNWIANGASD
jgi:mono/diheme cytochrome c family protein